ncbi:Cell surface protein, contains right handed betahelix region [Halanaeroarchaeum sp. HSR-CO]|uniref:vWA domain-containing protein n=1 Tax=Halanaeroarchaeum sp. HSR-CO TaxID=2866382 RepID=UPI00217EF125|nr:vWA domain-containing protein [Halanaeroarchaeum sp. HSR-CO]UWG47986.1 Cell surface protein, contains right handed betahelix region [Halanaeroarchaeum sp. HSR-CO]
MGTPSTRSKRSLDHETTRSVLVGLFVVIVSLAVVAGSVSAAIGGVAPLGSSTDVSYAETDGIVAAENETVENETQAVDVVLVFDRSESMDANRHEIAKEMEGFDQRLDTDGKDIQYALLTYGPESDVRQSLTDDYEDFQTALNFGTADSRENASDALLAATDEFRDDSERIVIIVTNEDDDSSAAQRQAATDAMSSVDFLAVSPDDPIDSSCELHSPPCDTDTDNELRTMAADAGGDWIDVDSDSSTIVTKMATTVGIDESETSTGGDSSGTSGSSSYSTSSPDVDPVNGSVNTSTVEIGEKVQFSITLENDGSADGTADEDLMTEDASIASLDVDVPEDETVTATVNHSFDTPGTYELFYDHMHVATVEVTPLRDTGVSLAAPSETRLEATVTDARTNETVRIPVTHPAVSDSAFGPITAIWVTTTQDADFSVTVDADSKTATETAPFTDHVRPLAYPSVNTTLEESQIESFGIEYADGDDRIEFYAQVNNSSWTESEGIAIDPEAAGATTTNGTFAETGNESGTGVQYDVLTITTEGVESSAENESVTANGTVNETSTANGTVNETSTANGTVNETTTVQTTTVSDSIEVASNESATGVTLAWDQTVERYVATVPANTTVAFGVQQPGFVVESLTLDRDTVEEGEQVVATVTVDNDGLVPGSYETILQANGDPVADTTVYVPANDSREVSLSFSPDTPGEYTLDVGGSGETTLLVEAVTESPNETTTTENPETETASPGFTAIGVLVAALLVSLFVKTRTR